MSNIHPSAIVAPDARLHDSVRVGPYSQIEDGAELGEGCVVEAGVQIHAGTRIGRHNRICRGAQLGCEPQDLTFTPEKGRPLIIGDGNRFRENVIISRGVKTEQGTLIGDGNYFMCGFHAGHDCQIGNRNIFGSNSVLAGHVRLDDNIFVSGLVAIHQFCHIGSYVMIAGCTKVVKDIPPYTTADGNPGRIVGLNIVGLRRAGIPAATRSAIKHAYKILYHSGLNTTQALQQLKDGAGSETEQAIIEFFAESDRGVTDHR